MSTAATSADVRTPPSAAAAELRAVRTENRLRAERIRGHRLAALESRAERRRQLTESYALDWVTPYAELLDLTRSNGDPVFAGAATYWQRRGGTNWPIYRTEQDLALLRAPARMLLATNGYAQGLVEGLTSYALGAGCTYRASKVSDSDDTPREILDACQRVIDDFLELNQWHGGEQPGLEEELFGRSIEDGEFFAVTYPRDNGRTDVRVLEPEQVTQPPDSDPREYSFGVWTAAHDVQCVRGYYVQFGEAPTDGEEFAADEITHLRRNVRRGMKRGITDFAFDTYDSLYLGSRLRTNLGDTAAQQAAIVAVRQHKSGTKEEIEAFVAGDADFTQSDPISGRQVQQTRHRRGSWEEVPDGMDYIPGPIATSSPIHIQVLDACLRGAGQKWQAPPWLMSGDLNAMNYATSLTAESPFVRTILRRQRGYCEAFKRPVWFALRHYVRTHGLRAAGRVWTWEEIEARVKVSVTAPSPETRNRLEEAQRAQTEITLGVQSRQKYMQEQGRDPDQIEADNQEWQDKFGAPGQQLPTDPFGADAGAGGSGAGGGLPVPESWVVRTSALGRALLESGFTGEITDAAGRHRKYVDGHQVAASDGAGSAANGDSAPAAKPAAKSAAPKLAALAKNPKADLKFIEKLQAQYPEGAIEREWLDVAKDNASGVATRDLSTLAALHGKGPEALAHARRHYVLERLASAAAQAHADGDAAGAKALAGAIGALGGTPHGPAPGASTGFDASYYDGPSGTFTGDPVRVTLQPVVYNGALVYRGKVASGVAESLVEAERLARALLEAGFTGTVKDSAGRERHYVDGKQVAAPKNDDGGNGSKDGSHKGSADVRTTPEERKAVEDDLAAKLGPDAAKKPGLLARVADVALTCATKVYAKMIEWEPAAHKVASLLGNVIDTPADMAKLGYNPGFGAPGNAAVANNDPIAANLGIGGHMAISIASNVLSRAILFAKGKLSGAKSESEYDGVRAVAEMLADLFASINDELGATGGAPSADEVAANIKKLLGAK